MTDGGRTYRGAAAIETWLTRTAGEYTYAIERTEAWKAAPEGCLVTHHLEGDSSAAVVDLHYRSLRNGRIEALAIET
ncbi:hypothetical protein [Streptomyces griseoluteus]|uniref:hypothetical protein n=1 Tax=Streptomyces griseoluteus TaxID=29306 RepID=UPI00368A99BC